MYREIDGVAQASAFLAFSHLADLESAAGDNDPARHFRALAQRLAQAAETHFWDAGLGYYVEHLAYNPWSG